MLGRFMGFLNHPEIGLLLLRLIAGGSMMTHGYAKLTKYSEMSQAFADPFGMGPTLSLIMVIFAELVCAALVVAGIFTRLATIPILVTMLTAFFVIHGADPFQKKELAFVYIGVFSALLFCGSGRLAVRPD